jgi:hypothetical protein
MAGFIREDKRAVGTSRIMVVQENDVVIAPGKCGPKVA